MRSLISFWVFVFSQGCLNFKLCWCEYLRFIFVLFCLWGAGFLGFLGHHWILQYKEDIRQVTAMTFYLSPRISDPVRDSFLIELRSRPQVVDIDFISSQKGGEYFSQYLGLSELKKHLNQDPLPSKVKVYFKADVSLDVLKVFMDEVSAAPYVETAQFNAQNWIHFQNYLSMLGLFSPVMLIFILIMTYLNSMHFIQRCFVGNQWVNVWQESGVGELLIRVQVMWAVIMMMVLLWGLVMAFSVIVGGALSSVHFLESSLSDQLFDGAISKSLWVQGCVLLSIALFHPFVPKSLKSI